MAEWIIGVVLYCLIGYGVAGGLYPDWLAVSESERSARKKARSLCLFSWPMEIGFFIGVTIRHLQKNDVRG